MANLKSLRDEVDKIDDQIFNLLVKRFNVAQDIAVIKAQSGSPALDPKRWEAVEQRIKSNARAAGLDAEDITHIYRAIHSYVLNNIYGS